MTRERVLRYYPQAAAVDQLSQSPLWFVFEKDGVTARLLGEGNTEEEAWKDALRDITEALATAGELDL